MFEAGAVYRFAYLWNREKLRGEESGRKDRPACLLLRPPDHPGVLIMMPITGTKPDPEQVADLIPESECKRLGLRSPAWIVLNEYNLALVNATYDFASLNPLGRFSETYQRRLRGIVRQLLASKNITAVRRD
jgi:hypothetical protein